MADSHGRLMDAGMAEALGETKLLPALLFFADFPTGAVRCWTGYGILTAMGEQWIGVGELIGMSEITDTTDTAQKGVSVTLSGVAPEIFDPVMLGRFQGRDAAIYLLAFTAEGEPWGQPHCLFAGAMDSDEIEDSGREVSITIKAESELSDQLKPRVWRYTHNDQRTLYPDADDMGFEFVAALQDVRINWGKK